jgi:hypothetical protein
MHEGAKARISKWERADQGNRHCQHDEGEPEPPNTGFGRLLVPDKNAKIVYEVLQPDQQENAGED